MAASTAAKNRKIRQDTLRELLSNQKLVEKVVEIAKKLDEQGAVMEPQEIQAKKAAADLNLKLINKYLPDVRTVELTGDGGGAVETDNKWTVEFVNASPESKS